MSETITLPIFIFPKISQPRQKLEKKINVKKCDNLMARLRSRGFVWGSTGISSQNIHYYNHSDIGFFWTIIIIYTFNKMKKEKSSLIVLSCSESSGDESENAMPKIDKEELTKYLQNSDEENESVKKTSPKKSKKLVKKRKTSSHNNVDQDKSSEEIKNQRNPLKKTHPKNISSKVMISKDFKKGKKTRRLIS